MIVNKINFFREIKEKEKVNQIDDYIENILLLFPSYFFREKDNIQILETSIVFCRKLNKSLTEKQENLLHKLLLFLYSIDENKNEILNILEKKESNIERMLKEEILFLKEIRNNDNNNYYNLEKLIHKDTSREIIINIYHEIAANYFKNKNYNYTMNYLKKILNLKNISNFIKYRIILDYCYAFIKLIRKDKNNKFFEINEQIKYINKTIKNSIQKDMYYESQKLKNELHNMIEPDIVMLNSNSLETISNYNFPLNNQYHILNELKKNINTHIRIKSHILNKENLYDALEKF